MNKKKYAYTCLILFTVLLNRYSKENLPVRLIIEHGVAIAKCVWDRVWVGGWVWGGGVFSHLILSYVPVGFSFVRNDRWTPPKSTSHDWVYF